MRFTSIKPLFQYMVIIFIVVLLTGIVLSPFVTSIIPLFLVLLTEYIILLMLLHNVYDKYIKPIQKATDTIDELVKGNFRARMYHPVSGNMASLLMKINALARSLSELSMHDKVQAEQLRTVIENIQSGIVFIDEKGYIHLVNKNFLSIFGKTEQELLGYLYYDVIEHEKIHKTIQQTFLYEDNAKDFATIVGKTKQYFEIVSAPIFDERNLLKGAVLVLYDISELKQLEVMRKDFVANVSHELKTPITSIRGFSETLLDDELHDKETAKHFLGIIHEESKRLQTLIEDLLTLSKLEKEDFILSKTSVSLSQVIDQVIPVLEQQAERKNIQLIVNNQVTDNFRADVNGIKQVILNLLVNAINYTPENGKVTLQTEEIENVIHIKVSDTGIGIPKEELPRIFERFYRVDKARSRNTGGTGLGLAIVKHIVEQHKGSIEVESKLDVGTTFTIHFPK